MSNASSIDAVFEDVLAGKPLSTVKASLNQLPPAERQQLLCMVCGVQDEIARNCVQHGELGSALLADCPFYIEGVATCHPGAFGH